jgi:hypothetical protein
MSGSRVIVRDVMETHVIMMHEYARYALAVETLSIGLPVR